MATTTSAGPSGISSMSSDAANDFTSTSSRMEAMSGVLAENWWAIALRGVLAILFGIIAFAAPGATILSLVLLFSAYMLVDGVFAIVAAVRAARRHERWGLLVLEGIANIAVGIIVFLWPGLTVVAFVLWMAVWSIISGALMVGASFQLKGDHGRGWLAVGGIVSIIYGILLAIAPLIGAIVLTWWLGAYAFVFGAALIALAFQLKARKDQGPSVGTAQPA
jgi:uncharacterized membrane protein HdeD (DUF308 family)